MSAPHVLFSALLSSSGANAIPALGAGDQVVYLRLDGIGKDEIAEQISVGRLPNEVALYYGVPVRIFRRWMADRFNEDEMQEMRAAAAESLQVKAVLTLSALLKNPAEASQAKALSERFAKQAEALDPKAWNPSHISPQRAAPTVIINGVLFSEPQQVVDDVAYDVVESPPAAVLPSAGQTCHGAPPDSSQEGVPTVDFLTVPLPSSARKASEGM